MNFFPPDNIFREAWSMFINAYKIDLIIIML